MKLYSERHSSVYDFQYSISIKKKTNLTAMQSLKSIPCLITPMWIPNPFLILKQNIHTCLSLKYYCWCGQKFFKSIEGGFCYGMDTKQLKLFVVRNSLNLKTCNICLSASYWNVKHNYIWFQPKMYGILWMRNKGIWISEQNTFNPNKWLLSVQTAIICLD